MSYTAGSLWVVCGLSEGPRLMEVSQSRLLMNIFYSKLLELEKRNREKRGNNLNSNSLHINTSHKDMYVNFSSEDFIEIPLLLLTPHVGD